MEKNIPLPTKKNQLNDNMSMCETCVDTHRGRYLQNGKMVCETCVRYNCERVVCLGCGTKYPNTIPHCDLDTYPVCPCYDDVFSETSSQDQDDGLFEDESEESESELEPE
jgi:hypothetical protein